MIETGTEVSRSERVRRLLRRALPEGSHAKALASRPSLVRVLVVAAVALALAVSGFVISRSTKGPSSRPKAKAAAPATSIAVLDTFNRPDNSTTLGSADTGQAWKPLAGVWGVEGRAAYVSRSAPFADRDMVLTNMRAGDGTVQVTIAAIRSRSGLVFRFRDQNNYWRLEAIPKFGTWVLEKIVDGKPVSFGRLGPLPVHDGTAVAVHLRGPAVDVFLDGNHAASVSDPGFAGSTGVGLSVQRGPDAAKARWKDFIATPEVLSATNTTGPVPAPPTSLSPGTTKKP